MKTIAKELLTVAKLLTAGHFNDLNDFAVFEPDLKRGNTEIWYQDFGSGFSRGLIYDKSTIELGKTHKLLGKIHSTNLEDIFRMLQGEFWSPNGEARQFIQSRGLKHTSMSVGDVVKIGSKTWVVAPMGFDLVE